MQLLPLVGFYLRRNQQIRSMLGSVNNEKSSLMVLEIVSQAMPLLKKYYPELNKDGLLDDVYTTLQEVLDQPETK